MDTLYDLLQKIRERPTLYLGEPSITFLNHFISGYAFGRREIEVGSTNCLAGFQEYVQKYYNTCLTKGWAGLILDHSSNQKEALEKFFELLDEHIAYNFNAISGQPYRVDACQRDEFHYGFLHEGKVYCSVYQRGLPLAEWVSNFTMREIKMKLIQPGDVK